jgi:hypothetical protein
MKYGRNIKYIFRHEAQNLLGCTAVFNWVDVQLGTRQYIPEDSELHVHCRENLKSHVFLGILHASRVLLTLSTGTGSKLRVSSGSIVCDYGLDDRAIGFRFPAGAEDFPLASVSRPALGPTQPPVQWVPGVLSRGVKRGRGVMLTTHPHLVPRS